MLGQETHNLGAMIVHRGYKLLFAMSHGHSRLDRPNEKFCWIYARQPPTLIIAPKMVRYVDFKDILQKSLKCSKNICLYILMLKKEGHS